MTKAEMIKAIQELEAAAFLRLKQDRLTFGEDSAIVKTSRTKWGTIYDLMETLNIDVDTAHPDNHAAAEVNNQLSK